MSVSNLNYNRYIELNNYYMLGVLADNEDTYPNLGLQQRSVTSLGMNNRDGIIFYIKRISSDPAKFIELGIEDNLFIGFADYSFNTLSKNFLGPRYNYVDANEKIDIIEEKLKDKIILFKPKIKYEANKERYHKNFDIIGLDDFNGIKKFESLEALEETEFRPILSPRIDKLEFEKKLLEGKNITFPEYNIKELEEFDITLCGDTIYTNLLSGLKRINDNTCVHHDPDNIKKIVMPEDFNENVIYKHDDNLLFISNDYYLDLDKKANDKLDKQEIISISSQERAQENNDSEVNSGQNESKGVIEEAFTLADPEYSFLDKLYQNALDKKLYYKKEDLYNLHISIKTSPLTIISGMSGTGKTKMAQLYAETLGLELEEEYVILPISPSYTEPDDLLGYLNTMNGIYTPAETGLVDLLVEASRERNSDKIYMVIFDEMNLSQVEHWFSPFISLLELDEDERKLRLYNKNNTCHNRSKYPASIPIGDNVIFIGTVNIDETTKDFSDRLLDRANVIIPNKLRFTDIKDQLENDELKGVNGNGKNYDNINNFNEWRKEPEDPINIMTKEELELLDRLHNVMNRVDAQKGVSFRIIKNIAKYLVNRPKNGDNTYLISRGDAFDIQIKQRVLTKIKGHQQQYGRLIGTINPDSAGDKIEESKIYEILDSDLAQAISDFERTTNELRRKAKEMYFNGYAT